jgi:hypothetical protein
LKGTRLESRSGAVGVISDEKWYFTTDTVVLLIDLEYSIKRMPMHYVVIYWLLYRHLKHGEVDDKITLKLGLTWSVPN